ncbi:hypothetical protein BG74_08905 [Sodalis-like endosymbiont of Proechinophthirus fluctus]|nr:hypothetical protein BG74_08905 [Sodalis-like endosymbiont of Proechinophthirus fluctus]
MSMIGGRYGQHAAGGNGHRRLSRLAAKPDKKKLFEVITTAYGYRDITISANACRIDADACGPLCPRAVAMTINTVTNQVMHPRTIAFTVENTSPATLLYLYLSTQ